MQVFGYSDCYDAGGQFEKRIKVGKVTKFEDLFIPDKVIIEMKSRGEDLQRHVFLAREYWNNSYDSRKTRFVILCNFDEFLVFNWYDQDAPLDKFKVEDLENRWRALTFLSKEPITPFFENNVEDVTKKAVEKLLMILFSLLDRGKNKDKVQKFIIHVF